MDPFARRRLGRTDIMLPQIGFGAAPLGELFTKVSEADAEATLSAAWDAGVRFYDTAPWYGRGQSEHRVGRFLYRQPREEVILSTKVAESSARRAVLTNSIPASGPAVCISIIASTTAMTASCALMKTACNGSA